MKVLGRKVDPKIAMTMTRSEPKIWPAGPGSAILPALVLKPPPP